MNWLILVIISVITLAISRLLQRAFLKDEQSNPILYSMFFQIFVGILFFLYTLTRGFNYSGYENYIPSIILMGILYVFGNVTISRAFKFSDASTVSVLFTTSTLWSVIGAILFLDERPESKEILGILFIISAVVLINLKKDFSSIIKNLSKGELYALAAGFFFGIAFLNDTYIIGKDRDLLSYLVINFFLPGILTGVIFFKEIRNIKSFLTRKTLLGTFIISVFYCIAALTTFSAYQSGGDTSIISPLTQLSTILIIISSIIVFKEREMVLKKILCGLIALVGLILISI